MHVVIVGSGRVGARLATALAAEEHDVVVIDRDPAMFGNLGKTFNGMTVTGNGIDIDVLKRAGIERADAFAAVTSHDNVNTMASQIAKRIFQVGKVIARINDPKKRAAYEEFGVETICPTDLGATHLRRMIQSQDFETVGSVGDDVLVIRCAIPAGIGGSLVRDLQVRGRIRLVAVQREGAGVILMPDDSLLAGDILHVAVHRNAVDQFRSWMREGALR